MTYKSQKRKQLESRKIRRKIKKLVGIHAR